VGQFVHDGDHGIMQQLHLLALRQPSVLEAELVAGDPVDCILGINVYVLGLEAQDVPALL